MIIDSKKTTVAYRCPSCGMGVISAVDMFSLNADMVKLKCTCGKSEMTVVQSRDGKIRLTVPCILCPTPHIFTLSNSLFYGKELFALQCPYSDINICFTGNADAVRRELDRTELELLDMLGEENLGMLGAAHGKELLPDPQIFDIIMFVIHDLEAENKIECRCEPGEGDFDAEVNEDGIRVYCKRCGASQTVPTDSLLGAHAFLYSDSLRLQ